MQFTRNITLYIVLSLVALCGAVSCDKAEYSGPPHFTLYLEDAPADYTSLRTSIEKVELQHADGTWLEIKNPIKIQFDILLLSGGQMMRIADEEIPAGKYAKLRVTFSESGADLVEGTAGTKLAIVPTAQVQEFAIDMTTADDLKSYLILDINAATSVINGEEGTRYFSPACTIVNDQGLGTLWGMISNLQGIPVAETMLVTVKRRLTGEVTMSYVNRKTAGIFQRLAPGTYDVTITPGPGSKYMAGSVENVTIDAGQSTQMGIIRLTPLPQQ